MYLCPNVHFDEWDHDPRLRLRITISHNSPKWTFGQRCIIVITVSLQIKVSDLSSIFASYVKINKLRLKSYFIIHNFQLYLRLQIKFMIRKRIFYKWGMNFTHDVTSAMISNRIINLNSHENIWFYYFYWKLGDKTERNYYY